MTVHVSFIYHQALLQ